MTVIMMMMVMMMVVWGREERKRGEWVPHGLHGVVA